MPASPRPDGRGCRHAPGFCPMGAELRTISAVMTGLVPVTHVEQRRFRLEQTWSRPDVGGRNESGHDDGVAGRPSTQRLWGFVSRYPENGTSAYLALRKPLRRSPSGEISSRVGRLALSASAGLLDIDPVEGFFLFEGEGEEAGGRSRRLGPEFFLGPVFILPEP